jgi:hypothetical protein
MKPALWAKANKGRTLREKLMHYTGVTEKMVEGMHAHHIIPKAIWDLVFRKFGRQWEEFLNSAFNGMWWEARSHLSKSKDYEKALRRWLEDHPNATFEQFFEAAKKIAKEMGAVG